MRRSLRKLLTPGWVAFHLLTWAAAAGMVLLGRWQLDVSNSKHFDLQNFGYALQWWAFSVFAVLLWAKTIRDVLRGRTSAPSTAGELVLAQPFAGYSGPVELVARGSKPGAEPIVYRGYLMPQSSTSPARSDGDPVRGDYNDYLWQLALADSAGRPDRVDPAPINAQPIREHEPAAADPPDDEAGR